MSPENSEPRENEEERMKDWFIRNERTIERCWVMLACIIAGYGLAR